MANIEQRRLIEDLQLRYGLALDRKNMAGWAECFEPDGSYLCQTSENHARGLPIGYMWDDTVRRIQDRVKTVNDIWGGTAEDYQPRHIVQCLQVEGVGDGQFTAVSNFAVFYTTTRGDSAILATGEYHDKVRVSADTAKLVSRKAILDQVTVPRYLVYPI